MPTCLGSWPRFRGPDNRGLRSRGTAACGHREASRDASAVALDLVAAKLL